MAYTQIHCKNYLWFFIIMCNEKITEQQKQLFILKLKNNNNNDNTRLLNYYSLSNILCTGGTKLIDYLCALIDLFTDMAAILNLLDLRSIMGCPWGHEDDPVYLHQYLRVLFGPIFLKFS